MRTTILGLMLLISATATAAPATSGKQSYTCKYVAGDLKRPVVGRGSTQLEAKEAASKKCFKRRVSNYERARGKVSMKRGRLFIDSCVNIECS